MIPKKIHYCWFGRNPKPELAKKCIKSWEKYCPDYEIIEWNEDNFDISAAPLYVRQAYEAKKWAFVTDYVRLQVVYEYGGIYLDTDVELLKNWDHLLTNKAFFGFEGDKYVNTGVGFGAEKHHYILREIIEDYYGITFMDEEGIMDTTPCPQRNTEVFLRHGLRQDGAMQTVADSLILPSAYLNPKDYSTGKIRKETFTLSIHHFSASWQTAKDREEHRMNKKLGRYYKLITLIHRLTHLPNMVLCSVLGKKNYERLKKKLKRG